MVGFLAKHAREQRRKGVVKELRNKKQKIRNKKWSPYFLNSQPLEPLERFEPLEPFYCFAQSSQGSKDAKEEIKNKEVELK